MVPQSSGLDWRTSSVCLASACVEVAQMPGGGVAVRDTKDRAKPAHMYSREEWAAFITGVKNGEFDFPAI